MAKTNNKHLPFSVLLQSTTRPLPPQVGPWDPYQVDGLMLDKIQRVVKSQRLVSTVSLVSCVPVGCNFLNFFSQRRADTTTVDTPLSPHCLQVCGHIHEIFSSCLHCSICLVIVRQLWGLLTYFTVINCRFSSFLCTYFCNTQLL